MPERLSINIGVPGKEDDEVVWVPLTLAEVIEWIKKKPYDEHVKQALIKQASRYPGQALRDFVNNIGKQIARIQRQKRQEEK